MTILDDALGIWSNRIAMTDAEKQLFSSYFRGRGFYMAGVWEETFLERMMGSIQTALAEGQAFGDWLPKAQQIVSSFGGGNAVGLYTGEELSMSYAELVFRNATQSAMAGGRYSEMFSKDGVADAAYWRYHVIDDNRLRPEHRALKGMVFAKNDAEGRVYLPPLGHNCRCFAVDISREDIDDEGLRVRRGKSIKWQPPDDWNTDRVAQLVPEWFIERKAA